MNLNHWIEVAQIYEAGIATKNATFETRVPDWNVWDKAHRKDCRLVAIVEGRVVGWVALSNVSGRCVYAGVTEESIYVAPSFQGQGIGSLLLEAVIEEAEKQGFSDFSIIGFFHSVLGQRLWHFTIPHPDSGLHAIGIRQPKVTHPSEISNPHLLCFSII